MLTRPPIPTATTWSNVKGHAPILRIVAEPGSPTTLSQTPTLKDASARATCVTCPRCRRMLCSVAPLFGLRIHAVSKPYGNQLRCEVTSPSTRVATPKRCHAVIRLGDAAPGPPDSRLCRVICQSPKVGHQPHQHIHQGRSVRVVRTSGTVSGTAQSADEGRSTITATRWPIGATPSTHSSKPTEPASGAPTTTPRRANTWPQVGMNGRPFLDCAMLISGAS